MDMRHQNILPTERASIHASSLYNDSASKVHNQGE